MFHHITDFHSICVYSVVVWGTNRTGKEGENHTTHRKSCDRPAITLTGNHVLSKPKAHVSASVKDEKKKNNFPFLAPGSIWQNIG